MPLMPEHGRREPAVEPGAAAESSAGGADQALTAQQMGRSHVRGSALFTGGRLISLLFTVTTQVVIVRYLSKTDYGAFAYALTLVGAGRMLLSLGQGKMLSRFLSVFDEERQFGKMLGSLFLAIVTVALTSAVGLALPLLFVDDLATSALGEADAVTLLLVLVVLAPMEALDEIFISVFAVFTKARAIFIRKYLLTPGLRLAVVLLMVATGQSVLFLAIGYVAAQVVGLLVYTGMLVQLLRARHLLGYLRPRRISIPVRAVFALAIPSLTGVFVYLSMNTGSVVLLSVYWGAAEIAAYRAVFPAARLNQLVFTTFTTLYLPMAARLFSRKDGEGTRTTYWQTAVLLLVLSFPIFAMTTVFASVTTVTLFGQRYEDSSTVLALMSLGYYLNVALGFNAHTLGVFGRGRHLILVNTTAAIGNLLLCLLLIPEHGAVGVALANCLTLLLQNVLNQWGLKRTIDTSFLDAAYVRPYVAVATTGAGLWALQAVLSPGLLGALLLVTAASILLVLWTRRDLHLADTAPELARVPFLRPFLR
jgi:O-antigen/teichoic acid export membrane protein